jgi:hypothetical protein
MLRSFQRVASEPDAPVKQQATNAKTLSKNPCCTKPSAGNFDAIGFP